MKEETRGIDIGRLVPPSALRWGLVAVVVLLLAMLARWGRTGAERSSAVFDSTGVSSEVGFSRETTLGTASAPGVTRERAGERRVARTWTHVRSARRVSSEVEAVLLPGDTVVADSLSRGWYRVALEGEVLGYAHQSTLDVPGEGERDAKGNR